MLEPNATGQQTQTADPNAAGAGAADAYVPMSNEDMLKQAQERVPLPTEVGENESDAMKAMAAELSAQKFENFLDKGKAVVEREYPNSTEDQRHRFMESLVTVDIAELVRAAKDMQALSDEKEEKSEAGEALNVQGTSTGTQGEPDTLEGKKRGMLEKLNSALGLT